MRSAVVLMGHRSSFRCQPAASRHCSTSHAVFRCALGVAFKAAPLNHADRRNVARLDFGQHFFGSAREGDRRQLCHRRGRNPRPRQFFEMPYSTSTLPCRGAPLNAHPPTTAPSCSSMTRKGVHQRPGSPAAIMATARSTTKRGGKAPGCTMPAEGKTPCSRMACSSGSVSWRSATSRDICQAQREEHHAASFLDLAALASPTATPKETPPTRWFETSWPAGFPSRWNRPVYTGRR